MSLSLGWDPTPSSPLGVTARVAPSWGGQAQGGAEALWGNQMAYGMGSHQMYGSGGQLNTEVGYGLPVGARFVERRASGWRRRSTAGSTRSVTASGCCRRAGCTSRLGVDAGRRESPEHGEASNGLMGRATLGW